MSDSFTYHCFSVWLEEHRDGRKKYQKNPVRVYGVLSARTKKEVKEKCYKEYPNYDVVKITKEPEEVEVKKRSKNV